MDSKYDALERRIQQLEERIQRLEGTHPIAPAPAQEPIDRSELEEDETSTSQALPLIGRTLIILGGAFLLRVLTRGEYLNPSLGAAIGAMYGLLWLFLAHRAGRADQAPSALLYGVTSTMIVLPLFWETTVKLQYLSPGITALGLTLFLFISFIVAKKSDLPLFLWLTVAPAAPLFSVLGFLTKEILPFYGVLLLLAYLSTLPRVTVSSTLFFSWVAVVANFSFLILNVARWTRLDSPPMVGLSLSSFLGLQVGLALIYWQAETYRALRARIPIVSLCQLALSVAIATFGIFIATADLHWMRTILGLAAMGLGSVSYFVGTRVEKKETDAPRITYAHFGITWGLTVASILLAFGPLMQTGLLVLLTVGFLWLSRRRSNAIFLAHAGAFSIAAAATSGAVTHVARGLFAQFGAFSEWFEPAAILAVSGMVIAFVVMGRAVDQLKRKDHLVLRAFIALFLISGTNVLVATGVTAALSGILAAARTTPYIAMTMTMLMSISALLMCRFLPGRSGILVLLIWALLIGIGVKIAFQDLPHGEPLSLFGSLATYGVTLILVPKWVRKFRK